MYEELVHGKLTECENEAKSAYSRFGRSDPQWATRFGILEARALLEQGRFDEALEASERFASTSQDAEVRVSAAAVAAVAEVNTHRFDEAKYTLAGVLQKCGDAQVASCGQLFQALGILADEQSDPSAEGDYQRSLSFARLHHDAFLESNSLVNLGNESLTQGRFDEAATRSQNAYESATKIGARVVALIAKGNVGWASYRLGDVDGALELSLEAEKEAVLTGDVFDRENLLTNLGYIYMDQRKFELAAKNFREALELAKNIRAEQDKYNAFRVLAKLGMQTGDLEGASDNAEQALKIARESHNHADELYPMLIKGQVTARRGDVEAANRIFESIEEDPSCPVFLKWETQDSLAQLYEAQNESSKANQQYRAALATFETARAAVQNQDFQLSFLTNAAHIYDEYVHFLVVNGKTDEALHWADFSRARTLSEGLGLLSQNRSGGAVDHSPAAPNLNPQAIARRSDGTLLFYWLGDKQSYLWAADSSTTHLFTLPPRSDIEAAVQRYRSALNGPQNVLESGGDDGRALYQILIAPAESMLRKNAKVLVFPDGSLNNLNFETLIAPSPKPHFWIEDADVINASSLRILAASRASTKTRANRLLLIGDSVAVGKDYPELPKAADQMASVAKHFPADDRRIFSREQANPAAYLQNNPEQFSNIHFVAHGTASRLSPLDSAIVLSGDADNPSSFKLYARDIVHHRLKADLVTISACYGAGERQYSGEGLVGLAWAFLYAGSHNVIAALWDVADASTYQLMDRFYDELSKGATPDAALRAAKLSLLRSTSFRNPFYWAPFQLYAA